MKTINENIQHKEQFLKLATHLDEDTILSKIIDNAKDNDNILDMVITDFKGFNETGESFFKDFLSNLANQLQKPAVS